MTLKELLSISEFDWYTVQVTSIPDANLCHYVDFFDVEKSTAPDYKGPFYGKSHREKQRENVQKLKKYADREVWRIVSSRHSNPSIYVLEVK